MTTRTIISNQSEVSILGLHCPVFFWASAMSKLNIYILWCCLKINNSYGFVFFTCKIAMILGSIPFSDTHVHYYSLVKSLFLMVESPFNAMKIPWTSHINHTWMSPYPPTPKKGTFIPEWCKAVPTLCLRKSGAPPGGNFCGLESWKCGFKHEQQGFHENVMGIESDWITKLGNHGIDLRENL